MINNLSEADATDLAIQARLYDLRTMLIGQVQAYTAATRTADVQPIGGTYFDGAPQPWPMLPDVPVAFPQAMTWPLQAGDVVLLLFASRATDAAVDGGIDNDPQSPRFGHLNDVVAVPAGISTAGAPLDGTTADVVISQRSGAILVGDGAMLAAARQTDPVAAAVSMTAWLVAATAKLNALPGGAMPVLTDFGTISGGSAVVKVA